MVDRRIFARRASDLVIGMNEIQLTERELAIARKAASMAVEQMTNDFYKSVGKTVVTRFLVIVGGLAVAFALGKGWISTDAFK